MWTSMIAVLSLGSPAWADEPAPWRLVALYDLAGAASLGEQGASGLVWSPTPEMTTSCGPVKAPDGLGVFEAEAMASGLSPTLAILLRRDAQAPARRPRADEVRVSLQQGDQRVTLQPAVMPRALRIQIDGDADPRHMELVRTMFQRELCLEHKVGRAWIGGVQTEGALREAYLLDPPEGDRADRRYFGGQRDPVPALLGPPDACLVWSEELGDAQIGGSRRIPGEASLDLVPSDIWGASLRWCDDSEDAGQEARSQPRPFPLRVSEAMHPGLSPSADAVGWQRLEIHLTGGPLPEDVRVSATLNAGVAGAEPVQLTHGEVPLAQRDPRTGEQGLTDLLAAVPRELPTIGWEDHEHQYAVLLVPAWQIDEALGRLARGDAERSLSAPGRQVRDGVGWVLEHPELLHVQVAPLVPSAAAAGEPEESTASTRWPDLMEPGGGLPASARDWGFPAGLLSGREPIATLGVRGPSWPQVSAAQRIAQHSIFLGSGAIVALLGLWGLRRRRDLWSAVPEERVDYWPGLDSDGPEPAAPPKAPAPPAAEGR